MKTIPVFIIILVFLNSCIFFKQNDRHYYLEKNDKSMLHVGDTLVYISNLNNKAAYVVIKKTWGDFYENQTPVALNATEGKYKDYYQYEATFIDSVGKVLSETQLSALKDIHPPQTLPLQLAYMVSGRSCFISIMNCAEAVLPRGKFSANWYNFHNHSCQQSTSLKILNQKFMNVLYCDIDQPSGTIGRYVTTVYYNPQKCLIGFKYSDGEIFELN